jgi:hypothetical protein
MWRHDDPSHLLAAKQASLHALSPQPNCRIAGILPVGFVPPFRQNADCLKVDTQSSRGQDTLDRARGSMGVTAFLLHDVKQPCTASARRAKAMLNLRLTAQCVPSPRASPRPNPDRAARCR